MSESQSMNQAMSKFGKRLDGPGGRRSTPRCAVLMSAALHTVGASRTVSVLDVSKTGAKLRSWLPMRLGQEVWLKMLTNDAFGRIAWVDDTVCGVQFERPLGEAAAAELQAMGKVVIMPRLSREEQLAALDWQTNLAR
jgi:hypothetical protein